VRLSHGCEPVAIPDQLSVGDIRLRPAPLVMVAHLACNVPGWHLDGVIDGVPHGDRSLDGPWRCTGNDIAETAEFRTDDPREGDAARGQMRTTSTSCPLLGQRMSSNLQPPHAANIYGTSTSNDQRPTSLPTFPGCSAVVCRVFVAFAGAVESFVGIEAVIVAKQLVDQPPTRCTSMASCRSGGRVNGPHCPDTWQRT
jgi:hypothetical protein